MISQVKLNAIELELLFQANLKIGQLEKLLKNGQDKIVI